MVGLTRLVQSGVSLVKRTPWWLRFVVGICFSLALGYLALRALDWGQIHRAFADLSIRLRPARVSCLPSEPALPRTAVACAVCAARGIAAAIGHYTERRNWRQQHAAGACSQRAVADGHGHRALQGVRALCLGDAGHGTHAGHRRHCDADGSGRGPATTASRTQHPTHRLPHLGHRELGGFLLHHPWGAHAALCGQDSGFREMDEGHGHTATRTWPPCGMLSLHRDTLGFLGAERLVHCREG